MRRRGPRARWVVAASLLLSCLLLIAPQSSLADGKPTLRTQKRVAARQLKPIRAQPAIKRKTLTSRIGNARAALCARMGSGRAPASPAPQLVATRRHAPLLIGPRLAARFCAPTPPRPETAAATEIADNLLLARVGPARVPTRLFVAVPEFSGEPIEFLWPADGIIASGFGRRHGGWHAGIDIMAEPGAPVRAAASGVVSFSGWAGSYGHLVKIQHPNGFVTVYAHNDEILVQVGDEVEAGAQIATVGRTGKASGEHLHFEIRRDEVAFNPLYLLAASRDAPALLASTENEASEVLLQAAAPTEPVDYDGAP